MIKRRGALCMGTRQNINRIGHGLTMYVTTCRRIKKPSRMDGTLKSSNPRVVTGRRAGVVSLSSLGSAALAWTSGPSRSLGNILCTSMVKAGSKGLRGGSIIAPTVKVRLSCLFSVLRVAQS